MTSVESLNTVSRGGFGVGTCGSGLTPPDNIDTMHGKMVHSDDI